MSTGYAKRIPTDENSTPMQTLPPPFQALQDTVAAPPAASSVITFTPNTTCIEITTGSTPIALKWGVGSVIAAAGTANFDHLVPIGTTRRFVIPISTQGVGSVVGRNVQAGLFGSMAVIAASSIVTGITEY